MKKIFLLLILNAAVFAAHAQPYYEAYPISVTQNSNGTQSRLELSCYDSLLATTATLNTPYFDDMYYQYSTGIVSYVGANSPGGWGIGDAMFVAVTYDHEIHQWKTTSVSENPCPESYSAGANNGVFSWYFDRSGSGGSDAEVFGGRYNILKHSFSLLNRNSHDDCCFGLSVDRLYATTHCGYQPADEHELYFYNYKNGTFNYGIGYAIGFAGNSNGGYSELTAYSYDNSWFTNVFVNVFDPAISNHINLSYFNADYFVDRTTYVFDCYSTSQIYYTKYDAGYHTWVVDSLPQADVDTIVQGQNVIAFKNTANNMVICAVYDFNKHRWEVDSVQTAGVSTLNIANGTVKWFDGSTNQQRGYDPVLGWNNNPTVLCPFFYAPDFSQPNGGNLTFVRDYSIGATSASVNFGDGFTGQTDDWHLYKKNGSYAYQGSPLTDTICYTVYNSGNTATKCVSINCFTPLPTITSSSPFLCVGDSAVFTITGGASSYQWLHNNTPIVGATASTYITPVAGKYQCMVTDGCGVRYSNQLDVQNLFVSSALIITTLNQVSFCSNSTNFQLTVNQSLPQTNYLWMRDSVLLQTSTSNTSAVLTPVSGNYYCILSNGCVVDTTNTLNILVGQNPSAIILSNGQNTFCLGDSLKLSISSCNSCSYQWKYGGTTITGATNSIYYALQSGTYYCLVVDTTTNCSSISNYLNLSSTTLPIPNVTLTCNKTDTLCYPTNNNTTLSVGTHYQGNNYTWRKNGLVIGAPNSPNYTLNITSGTYDCIVSNLCGADTSNALTFFVEISQQPFISNSNANHICINDSALLTINPSNGFYYQWSNSNIPIQGATNNIYSTKSTGIYSCFVTGSFCSAVSNNCYVTAVNNPSNNIISSGPTTFCTPNTVTLQSSYLSGTTYQWLKNGVTMAGSTSSSYLVSNEGNYQVIATDIYGCDSTSAPVFVNVPCATPTHDGGNTYSTNRALSTGSVNLYPNPTSQKLFLESNSTQNETLHLKIMDVLGKEIISKQLSNNAGYNMHELNLEKLKPAVYFLEVKNNDSKNVFKIVKK